MFHELYGAPVVILRPFMTYGPGQALFKLVPSVTLSLLRGERPKLSSGKASADWVYIDDVIEGFVAAGSRAGYRRRDDRSRLWERLTRMNDLVGAWSKSAAATSSLISARSPIAPTRTRSPRTYCLQRSCSAGARRPLWRPGSSIPLRGIAPGQRRPPQRSVALPRYEPPRCYLELSGKPCRPRAYFGALLNEPRSFA